MPKFNLDEDETLSEPIEIVIEGKTFVVRKITDKIFKKIGTMPSVAEQFAYLTGTKLSVVNNLNLMKVAKAIQYIINSLMGSMGVATEGLFAKREPEEKETTVKND